MHTLSAVSHNRHQSKWIENKKTKSNENRHIYRRMITMHARRSRLLALNSRMKYPSMIYDGENEMKRVKQTARSIEPK